MKKTDREKKKNRLTRFQKNQRKWNLENPELHKAKVEEHKANKKVKNRKKDALQKKRLRKKLQKKLEREKRKKEAKNAQRLEKI